MAATAIQTARALLLATASKNFKVAVNAALDFATLVRNERLEFMDGRDTEPEHETEDYPRERKWKNFVSKFPGTCNSCGRRYYVSDRIWWKKDVGAVHEGCPRTEG